MLSFLKGDCLMLTPIWRRTKMRLLMRMMMMMKRMTVKRMMKRMS